MATSCFIIDHTNNTRQSLFFKTPDFDTVLNAWDKPDALLIELSNVLEMFKDRTTWSSLDPIHWQLIVSTNLRSVADLPRKDQEDPENETVRSLHLLIMGFILCLEERCGYATIENVKITRLAELECSFDFNISMATIRALEEKPKPTFSVIVDNTDKK